MLFTTCSANFNLSTESSDPLMFILNDAITITMAGVSIQEKMRKKCIQCTTVSLRAFSGRRAEIIEINWNSRLTDESFQYSNFSGN